MVLSAVRELTVISVIIRILCAVILGGVLGFERGLKNRPAGLRTYILVCMGACIVMITNQYVYQAFQTGDPVRMSAQVISGIGFLGAGTIIVTARNQIKGLTTAAGLWASACTGLALGIGLYEVAFIGGIAIFGVLTILHQWDLSIRQKARVLDVYVELDRKVSIGDFMRDLRLNHFEPSSVQLEREPLSSDKEVAFLVTVRAEQHRGHDEILRTIRRMDGVIYLEEA